MQITFGARSRQTSPGIELGQPRGGVRARSPRRQQTASKDVLSRTLGNNRVTKTIKSSASKTVKTAKWMGKHPVTTLTTALAAATVGTFSGMSGHRLTTCKFDKVPEGAIAVIQGGQNTATAPCPIWMTKREPNGNARVSGGYDGFWKGIGDNGILNPFNPDYRKDHLATRDLGYSEPDGFSLTSHDKLKGDVRSPNQNEVTGLYQKYGNGQYGIISQQNTLKTSQKGTYFDQKDGDKDLAKIIDLEPLNTTELNTYDKVKNHVNNNPQEPITDKQKLALGLWALPNQ